MCVFFFWFHLSEKRVEQAAKKEPALKRTLFSFALFQTLCFCSGNRLGLGRLCVFVRGYVRFLLGLCHPVAETEPLLKLTPLENF